MSKIEQLIKEKCPNGVIFYKLSEISEKFNGLSGKTKADFENGNCRYISYTNLYKNPSINLKANDYVNIKSNEKQNDIKFKDILIAGSSENLEDSGMVSVVTNKPSEKIYLNSFCFGLRLTPKYFDLYNADFLKHLFRSKTFRSQITRCSFGVTRYNLSKDKLLKIKIPCPPIEVQEEIVKILDKFNKLEKELEKELKVRRKQYEFWCKQLLHKQNNQITIKKMYEIANFKNGKGHEKAINSIGPYIVVNSKFISTNGNVIKKSSQQLVPLHKDDVLILMSDLPNGKALAKTFIVDADNKYTLNQRIGCLTLKKSEKILPKYFYYILNRNSQLLKYDDGSSQTNLRKNDILNINLQIPSLEEQERIVKILDKFYKLINDISEGIPAEIEARRKQYEYYRNKLLSFEELKTNE